MNDYRNFERKKGRKKGTNHNKYAKGKGSLQQKNKYWHTKSNKQHNTKHGQRKTLTRNKTISVARKQGTLMSKPICWKKMLHEMKIVNAQERLNEINKRNFDETIALQRCKILLRKCKCNLLCTQPRSHDVYDLVLGCDVGNAQFESLNIVAIAHSGTNGRMPENSNYNRYRNVCNMNSNDNCKDNECKENLINFFEQLYCDVLLYSICDKYLYPHEIYKLLILSKNINKMLTSKNGSFFKQLSSKDRINKYILHAIDILSDNDENDDKMSTNDDIDSSDIDESDENTEFESAAQSLPNLDSMSNASSFHELDNSDVWDYIHSPIRERQERCPLCKYLFIAFKSMLDSNIKNRNNDDHDQLKMSTIKIEYSSNWSNPHHGNYMKHKHIENQEILCTLKHLFLFCISNSKYQDITLDLGEHIFYNPHDTGFMDKILDLNKLKHLTKYFIANYNINQQSEMKSRGVVFNHIEKIRLVNEKVVLVFNKFDQFNQYDQRKIVWRAGSPCKCDINVPNLQEATLWHRFFARYINHSVDYTGLCLNKVFNGGIGDTNDIRCPLTIAKSFFPWLKRISNSDSDCSSSKCNQLSFILTSINVQKHTWNM